MRALDRLLHQLATAAGLELQPLLQHARAGLVQLPGGGGTSAKLGEPAPNISGAATLLPLAAAMLSAMPQVGCVRSLAAGPRGACKASLSRWLPLSVGILLPAMQLRALYLSAAQAILPDEAAAAQAVAELAEQATGTWRVAADVQHAALAASLQAEAS